jgi:hypothetical protein
MDHNMAVAANECTSVVGHFDGHGGVPMQYGAHCPIQHDQGFTESYWMPPSGDYLLHIAPVAVRATINTTKMQKYVHFADRFDGHHDAPVLYPTHCLMQEVRDFHKSH